MSRTDLTFYCGVIGLNQLLKPSCRKMFWLFHYKFQYCHYIIILYSLRLLIPTKYVSLKKVYPLAFYTLTNLHTNKLKVPSFCAQ